MDMFCRFEVDTGETLSRSITSPLLSPNSLHNGSKSTESIYLYRQRATFYSIGNSGQLFFHVKLVQKDNVLSPLFLFLSFYRLFVT